MPSSPITISSERSTHSPTTVSGPTPARAGDAPAGWRAHPAPRSSARDPRYTAATASGVAAACAANSSGRLAGRNRARGRVPTPPGCARRSDAARISSAPIARIRRRHRRLQQTDQTRRQRRQRSSGQTGRWRIPACRRSPPARRPRRAPRPGSAPGRTSTSCVATASKRAATPSSSSATAALFWNASITWNSG